MGQNSLYSLDNAKVVDTGIQVVVTQPRSFIDSCIRGINMLEVVAGSKPLQLTGMDITVYTNNLQSWFQNVVNQLLLSERLFAAGSDESVLRQDLTSHPLASNVVGNIGSSNVDVNVNNKYPPGLISTTERTRTFNQLPIACILYMVGCLLLGNSSIRQDFNEVFNGFKVPKVWLEKANSNRNGQCGAFYISCTVTAFFGPTDLNLLGLGKSLLDINYLCTRTGLLSLRGLLSLISNSKGNYIEFVTYKPVNIEAGYTVTETALTIESTFSTYTQPNPSEAVVVLSPQGQVENVVAQRTNVVVTANPIPESVVRLLPGHSYGEKVDIVQLLDCYVGDRRLLMTSGQQLIVGPFSPTATPEALPTNWSSFIAMRGIGTLHNGTGTFKRDNHNSTNSFERGGLPDTAGKADGDGTSTEKPKFERSQRPRGRKPWVNKNPKPVTPAEGDPKSAPSAKPNGFVHLMRVFVGMLKNKHINLKQYARLTACLA